MYRSTFFKIDASGCNTVPRNPSFPFYKQWIAQNEGRKPRVKKVLYNSYAPSQRKTHVPVTISPAVIMTRASYSAHNFEHIPDGPVEPGKYRPRDYGVSYIEFLDLGDFENIRNVVIIQPMPGVHGHSEPLYR
jgi:hypothetical protein